MSNRRTFLRQLAAGSLAAATCGPRGLLAGSGRRRPNFLFLFADDQTFQSIHALNNPEVRTPNLDRLVKRGTVFTHAFNQGSWTGAVCVASRAMLNTGQFLYHAQRNINQAPLWGQTLGQAGYNTFFTGKWHNGNATLQKSFKTIGPSAGGMLPSTDPQVKQHKAAGVVMDPYNRPREGDEWSPSDRTLMGHWQQAGDHPKFAKYFKDCPEVEINGHKVKVKHSSELWADAAIDFLQHGLAAKDDPFFMYVAFHAPHDPRQSPQRVINTYDLEKIRIPPNFMPEHPFDIGSNRVRDEKLAPFPRTHRDVRVHRREYYSIITHMDEQVGRILEALDASGEADNTVIIFSADHGLAMGMHGLMGKQNQYDHSVRMPLIFVGPDLTAGRRVDALVYLQSLFATTCEMAAIPVPKTVEFPSLVPLLEGKDRELHQAIYGAYTGSQRMVRTTEWKLIVYPRVGETQLFNVAKDPWELTDLAEDSRYAAKVAELKKTLIGLQKQVGDQLDLEAPPGGRKARARKG